MVTATLQYSLLDQLLGLIWQETSRYRSNKGSVAVRSTPPPPPRHQHCLIWNIHNLCLYFIGGGEAVTASETASGYAKLKFSVFSQVSLLILLVS